MNATALLNQGSAIRRKALEKAPRKCSVERAPSAHANVHGREAARDVSHMQSRV